MPITSNYSVVKVTEQTVFLIDLKVVLSVTNDAEKIVSEILLKYGPNRKIVYRDSRDLWQELCHDGTKFTTFGSKEWDGEPPPELKDTKEDFAKMETDVLKQLAFLLSPNLRDGADNYFSLVLEALKKRLSADEQRAFSEEIGQRKL